MSIRSIASFAAIGSESSSGGPDIDACAATGENFIVCQLNSR